MEPVQRLLENSKRRLETFLAEVREVKDSSDFPYPHSKEALQRIEDVFQSHFDYLKAISDTTKADTIYSACESIPSALSSHLRYVGFILRSTNVRNAFEIYRPVLHLSRRLLGPSTKLVLSSEWEYSPHTIFGIPSLRDFVLIGFPAPESSNPLLVPLVGHELGHSLWAQRIVGNGSEQKFKIAIANRIIARIKEQWNDYRKLYPWIKDETELESGLFASSTWEPCVSWALRQAEETFCDFTGLYLFGESYLHAFAYLLSPTPGRQSVFHPRTQRRVTNLLKAAAEYGLPELDGYEKLFQFSEFVSDDPYTRFWFSLAEDAAASVIPNLVNEARNIVVSTKAPALSRERIRKTRKYFEDYIVPAVDAGSVANILVAAWEAFHNPRLWQKHPEIDSKELVLLELGLKSIEVLAVEQMLGRVSDDQAAEIIANMLGAIGDTDDPLVINPEPDKADLSKTGAASVDLRLGTWFMTLRETRMSILKIDDEKPAIREKQLTKTHYVPFGREFVLHPRCFVLGTTLEWIRLPKNISGFVVGRSSWGRRGLIIATATGVHPGFTGCLTLEISNVGEIAISIKPGLSICQFFLHEVHRTADFVDRSPFIGRRRPVLGTIGPDEVARTLGRSQEFPDG